MSTVIIIDAVRIAWPRLKLEEGFRSHPYTDTGGHTTVGYGFNLDAGITMRAAEALLLAQAQEIHEALLQLSWYAALDPVRQSVCLDIAFNAGEGGLLKFPHMIAALARQDWPTASTECRVENPALDASRYATLRQLLLIGGAQ